MKKIYIIVLVPALLLIVQVAKADYTFGEPINLGPAINTTFEDGGPCLTPDGLSLYYYSFIKGLGNPTVRTATRATTDEPWGEAISLSSSDIPKGASLNFSADGLSLYFESFALGGYGLADLFVSTRATIDAPWSNPENLEQNVNSPALDMGPTISSDGLSIFFQSNRSGGFGVEDIYVCTRATTSDPWGPAENLGENVNTSFFEGHPCILPDGLTLIFCSDQSGGYGDVDIWVTKRKSKDDQWDAAINLGPSVNTSFGECEPYLSLDGKELYFSDWWTPYPNGVGTIDLWQVSIEPVVDLNVDGIVDAADMCIVVDHWGTDSSICDIGPRPFGDGIVDVQDLIVLSEYLFEEVSDNSLVAHWAMDETEGMFAVDSAGKNDAFVVGGATWQAGNGQVNGALELDGISGCCIVGPVVNPADGPFSVLAWIKGGGPGQVVVSHQSTADWLAIDADGKLMTELKSSDPAAGPLVSDTVITDGQWHRIGLVWDGSSRKLYVDGTLAAEDAQDGMASFESGLYIGVGKNYSAGTFFWGLVDDVKVYNRVVIP